MYGQQKAEGKYYGSIHTCALWQHVLKCPHYCYHNIEASFSSFYLQDKTGISTRITFEALAGEKASSTIEVVNNGSAAIWYEWRRLPNTSNLGEHRKEAQVQHFYFNTSAGKVTLTACYVSTVDINGPFHPEAAFQFYFQMCFIEKINILQLCEIATI